MSVRPFVLLGAATLACIREAIARVTTAWSVDWIPGIVMPSVSCRSIDDTTSAADLSETAWSRRGQAPGLPIWVATAAPEVVRAWLFETTNRGDFDRAVLAGECADRALADFLQRIVELLQLSTVQEGTATGRQDSLSDLAQAGSGAVIVNVAIGSLGLELLLPGTCVAGFSTTESEQTRPLARVSPVSEGLAAQEVGLKVWLGKVEVTVGMLREISVGDVIRLPAPINDAMDVSTEDGAVLFKSYLGVKEGHLAIELCGRSSATEK